MAINPKLGYSDETQALIDRMCRNIERKDFVLDKEKAEELILKTYDLFGLTRPKKIVWCKSPQDEIFAGSSRSAWTEETARTARSAETARSAGSAGSAGSARSA